MPRTSNIVACVAWMDDFWDFEFSKANQGFYNYKRPGWALVSPQSLRMEYSLWIRFGLELRTRRNESTSSITSITKALEAALLFYERNPDKKPKGARTLTHPAAASRNSDSHTVMRAIPLPPLVPSQQVPAFTPSLAVPPEQIGWMSPAVLNVLGGRVTRVFPLGAAFTSMPEWKAQPALHAGQGAVLACTSQGQSEFHRPSDVHPPVHDPSRVAPPNSAAAGDLLSF